eukprot:TRINITY_DN8576_c0_g1_i1.p1 TRINITY_DN8576_c0_g1~~TRINITY_DN8576_c0_g1_i1.p1  ORF type:complete len:509 (+),score=117.72 TRINITY_DN8576_c0_g1_i1:54-1580(+)
MTDKSNDENIWEQVLSDSTNKRYVENQRTIMLVGSRNSGKRSLLAKIKSTNDGSTPEDFSTVTPYCVPITFSYIDMYENDTDDFYSRVNVWNLDGDDKHSNILDLVLTEHNLEGTVIVITLDFSEPWKMESDLLQWLKVTKNYISALQDKLSHEKSEYLQKKNIFDFQSYEEPGKEKKIDKPFDEKLLRPLDNGCLEHNFGVPIYVVCTKVDMFPTLEKDYGYKEDEFTFILCKLRAICLSYGASLIYQSTKRDINNDILFKLFKSHVFKQGDEWNVTQIIEKEKIYIPFGWDSLDKIELSFWSGQSIVQKKNQPQLEFKDIIYNDYIFDKNSKNVSKPTSFLLEENSNLDAIEIAEDDFEFLTKHLKTIEAKKLSDEQILAGKDSPMVLRTPSGGVVSPGSDGTGPESAMHTPTKSVLTASGLKTPSSRKTPPPSSASTPANKTPSSTPSGDEHNEHKVLADFFTSLMNGSRGAPRKSVGSAVASPAQVPSPSRAEAEKSLARLRDK